MKCAWTFLGLFILALVMDPCAGVAQVVRAVGTADAVALEVNLHPGATLRYTFAMNMKVTNRVDPSIPSNKIVSFTPRQYRVEGEFAATLAATQAGEGLHGTVQFKDLTVKNWVSSADVAGLEERLHLLETASIVLTTKPDGNFALAETSPRPSPDRYVIDAEDLESVAQALLVSRLTRQPMTPGQQLESADFPIPGMVKPGINLTVRTDYVADVPIALHRSAEVQLSMQVPPQLHPVSSLSSATKTTERYFANGTWTYLLDLDAHQISFLQKSIRTETAYSAELADSNDPVRIPRNLFTVDTQFDVTARQVAESPSPQREADLSAFEKSLQSPSPQAATVEAPAASEMSPAGETSLGDIARRYRAQRAAQEPPPAEAAKPEEAAAPGTSASLEKIAAGFKVQAFSSGNMTAQIPSPATDIIQAGDVVTIRYHLGNPTPLIVIVLVELNVGPGEPGDHAFDGVIAGLQTEQGVKGSSFPDKTD